MVHLSVQTNDLQHNPTGTFKKMLMARAIDKASIEPLTRGVLGYATVRSCNTTSYSSFSEANDKGEVGDFSQGNHPAIHVHSFSLSIPYEMSHFHVALLAVILGLSQNVLADIKFTMLYVTNQVIDTEQPYPIVWTGAVQLANITFADSNGSSFAIECMCGFFGQELRF
jgi:hypothetical protein